jgi:hypothetical protein
MRTLVLDERGLRLQREAGRRAGRPSLVAEAAELHSLNSTEYRALKLWDERLSRDLEAWRHRQRRRAEGWQGGGR